VQNNKEALASVDMMKINDWKRFIVVKLDMQNSMSH